jgi:hypothetical protein
VVLCRKCAFPTRPTMASCPRCGWALPYWRSRRWRVHLNVGGAALGKHCPRCGFQTTRRPSPWGVRIVRFLTRHRCSYRTCGCGWHGVAFHARTAHRQAKRPS